jgi:hypothetical protein
VTAVAIDHRAHQRAHREGSLALGVLRGVEEIA